MGFLSLRKVSVTVLRSVVVKILVYHGFLVFVTVSGNSVGMLCFFLIWKGHGNSVGYRWFS